jgi:hypothetical protein
MTTADALKRASRRHDLSVPNDATRRPPGQEEGCHGPAG